METYNKVSHSIRNMLRRPKVTLILVAILVGAAVLAYVTLQTKTPEDQAAKELASAVVAVGKLMILPDGDEPVLATVTDAEALIAQQAFFAGAIDGDQLLLFPKSLKAVIYSPSRNKIINAGPIEQGAQTTSAQSSSASGATSQSDSRDALTIDLRNGSGVNGAGSSLAQQISQDARFSVVRVGDAKSNEYTATVVVNISKKSSGREAVNALASALSASVVSALPKDESPSNADVVVIIGSGTNQ